MGGYLCKKRKEKYPNRKDWKSYICGNFKFLKAAQETILKNTGLKLSLSQGKGLYYLTCYGNKKNTIFLNWLYQNSNIFLDRKYKKYTEKHEKTNNNSTDSNVWM